MLSSLLQTNVLKHILLGIVFIHQTETYGSMSEDFGNCSKDEFRCHNDNFCVSLALRCNVIKDCQDGSDEINCPFPSDDTCQGFLCNNKCIEEFQRCDGLIDCDDKSDEKNCDSLKPNKVGGVWRCPEGKVACEDGSLCINMTKLCDNVTHCRDGSDEGSGCNVDTCKKKSCAHECIQTPRGPTCLCIHGYELQPDAFSCLDIDECANNESICSQICTNQPGNFTCSCMEGYKLKEYTNCKAEGPEPILIFSNDTHIRSIQIRSGKQTSSSVVGDLLLTVAYDDREERVYWSDVIESQSSIKSSKIDGSNIRTVISTGLQLPEDFVIDWIAWNLYFTDSEAKHIAVCSLARDSCKVIIKKNLNRPRGIIIEIENRWIFWTDWVSTPYIGRAGMDGSDRQFFVSTMLGWPNGLAIDYVFKRLYWSDAKLDHIERIGFDGKNREVVLGSIAHPFYLAIFEDTLYYSDWHHHTIESCDKRTGKNNQTLVKEAKKLPIGIHIYHPALQKNVTNFCELSLCSHQCVLTPNDSFKCLCPAGFVLSQDSKTCKDDKNATFILIAIDHKLFKFHPQAIGNNVFHRINMKTEPTTIADIVYDPVDQMAIILDSHTMQILALNFTTLETTVLVSKHTVLILSLAFDKYSRNLYWTDGRNKSIIVMSLATRAKATLTTTEFFPASIALVHKYGYLFVSSITPDLRIVRMNLDGSEQTELLRVPDSSAIGLTVDVIKKRLFWINYKKKVLNSITFDGKHSELINDNVTGTSALVYGNRLYWTIERSDIFWIVTSPRYMQSTVHSIPLLHKSGFPKLALMTPNLESEVDVLEHPNPCESSPCSHLCLRNQNNYTCTCPDNLVLHPNGSCYYFPEATKLNCDRYHFACEDGQKCLPMPWRCDGTTDCDDKSDEENCNCIVVNIECKGNSTLCIPRRQRCDGLEDCPDGSDEDCANATCNPREFRCNSGQCISLSSRCNSISECLDGSDEENCESTKCLSAYFPCDNGHCLPQPLVCNGHKDCPGGEDETGPQCDRKDDYGDNSEEEDYLTTALPCPSSTFTCLGSSKCIPLHEKCDGKVDCPDGEDELECADDYDECPDDKLVCNYECVKDEDKDKMTCEITCTQDEFRCDHGRCIDLSAVCDNKTDCADGSDESISCLSSACADGNGNCSQICTDTPRGPQCSCEDGYELYDGENCKDIDECEDKDICSQICYNTNGSYYCLCEDGYHLLDDGKSCRAKGDIARFFYVYPTKVMSMSIDQCKLYTEIKPGNYSSITDVDFDVRNQEIYWTDFETKTINRLSKLSEEVEVLITTENPPILIAVDWISTNFYYGDGGKFLYMCSTNPRVVCKLVITAPFNKTINSVALNPKESFLFYTAIGNFKNGGVIIRASMDGTASKYIVNEKLTKPTGLTVDFVKRRIYWLDAFNGLIETCDFYGDYRRKVAIDAIYPVFAIFEDKIYWYKFDIVFGKPSFFSCNTPNCDGLSRMYIDILYFQNLKIYHEVRQPIETNPTRIAQIIF